MIDIAAAVRSWLAADPVVASLCGDRVSTILDPGDGFPALVLGAVQGGPGSIPSRSVDIVETWSVSLYAYAGRRDGGLDDLPDTRGAFQVAQAVVAAAERITTTPFTYSEGGRIVHASVLSAVPGAVDPNTGAARATVTLRLVTVP